MNENEKISASPAWQIGPDTVLHATPYFDLVSHEVTTPAGHSADYFYMRGRDWIKVIPVTSDGKVILIDQFRPISNTMSLEIPGGVIDETDASPEAAARRELLEETGYTAERFEYLGWVYNNPAIFSNRSHVFLAHNAQISSDQKLDPTEEIAVVPYERKDLLSEIANGRVKHSIVLAALNLWLVR